MTPKPALTILTLAALALAGCAAPPPAEGDAPMTNENDPKGHAAVPNLVHAAQEGGDGNFFAPKDITIRAGETVTWDVTGIGHHTVTFAAGPNGEPEAPDSGDVGPGDTWAYTFEKPGTYPYYCLYHSNARDKGMVGTVIVEA